MYREIVQTLSKEQIDALQEMGIARSIVSNWKHGKRLPTRPQTIMLSKVCGVDPMELEKELMLLETPEDQRDLFKRLVGLAASICLISGALTAPGNSYANQRVSSGSTQGNIYTSWKVCLIRLGQLLALIRRLNTPLTC